MPNKRYRELGRVSGIRYHAAGATAPDKVVDFSYDAVGNLLGYHDGVTNATYVYDTLYRSPNSGLIDLSPGNPDS